MHSSSGLFVSANENIILVAIGVSVVKAPLCVPYVA